MPESVLLVIQTRSLLLLILTSDALPLLLSQKITNIKELEDELLSQNMHFAELSSSNTNQTELIALLIIQGKTFCRGYRKCIQAYQRFLFHASVDGRRKYYCCP